MAQRRQVLGVDLWRGWNDGIGGRCHDGLGELSALRPVLIHELTRCLYA
jgi:hypothetical protein